MSDLVEPRRCEHEPCRRWFVPEQATQKYHSSSCRENAYFNRKTKARREKRKLLEQSNNVD